ncbi:50S ribosomal protein L10 [Candidatus Woesearchaeota archaeon]|nr:50S ribosomal protein L10 [Candidatus Woesearchaeota archaeon]
MPAQRKVQQVAEFAKLLTSQPIVGVVNITNLPASQFSTIRASLRGKVDIRVGKRKLIKLAMAEAKKSHPGLAALEPHLENIMPGLLFTSENPFALAKLVQKNKSSAPAKAGQTAPNDIWVKAGPTPFAPGPIIGQLGQLGLKTSIEGGKIKITQDKLVVPEGKVISADAASLLTRMGITPMEIGLNLQAVYENEQVFTKAVLFIDEAQYLSDIASAAAGAFALAIKIAYPAPDVLPRLLAKASGEAKALALDAGILTPENAGQFLSRAEREAAALEATMD